MRSSIEELKALLLFSRTPGIRLHGLRELFKKGTDTEGVCPLFKKPAEILDWVSSGVNPAWKESLEATRKIFSPEKELEQTEKLGIQLIPFEDPNYPYLLKETSDPPLILYVRGNLIESDQAALAIVGSRHPSLYGLEQAKRFAEKLARSGLTIVSGFARGVDRAAHEGTLEVSYGRTIAVLGSGLNVVYPREHQTLYEEIAERGAIISEFALGTPPLAENFPKRNRIIAGLALGTLVVEAHSRSGSLITAHLAADEGREVFALPGRVDQLGSRGAHRLIQEGAALVESPENVFDALAPRLGSFILRSQPKEGEAPGPHEMLDEEEKEFLGCFRRSPWSVEEAVSQTRRPISKVTALLTHLELKGAVRRRLDGRYELSGAGQKKAGVF